MIQNEILKDLHPNRKFKVHLIKKGQESKGELCVCMWVCVCVYMCSKIWSAGHFQGFKNNIAGF
jgi:hypothetical protein